MMAALFKDDYRSIDDTSLAASNGTLLPPNSISSPSSEPSLSVEPLLSPATRGGNGVDGGSGRPGPSPSLSRRLTPCLHPGDDRPRQVLSGCAVLACAGTALGLVLRAAGYDLPSAAPSGAAPLPAFYLRAVSPSLGYSYFLAWSVSFYPQVVTNARTGSTAGLSAAFALLNLAGFACYAAYTCDLYWDGHVRAIYARRHGGAYPEVRGNDAAFALHALLLTAITVGQMVYYEGLPSLLRRAGRVTVGALTAIAVYGAATAATVGRCGGALCPATALDADYRLAAVKMAITVTKYCPQVWHNYARGSTVGWNIW